MRILTRRSWKFLETALLSTAAVSLVGSSGFALRCGLDQHRMDKLAHVAAQRWSACQQLGSRWEADDQQRQYEPGTSVGTRATVGPISGFVMDVSENEAGHAQGECHAINASYKELIAAY